MKTMLSMRGGWAAKHLRTIPFILLLTGLLAWSGGHAHARVDADSSKQYHVTPADGAWLICVTSYSGPNAEKYAHDLVLELRGGHYKIPAVIFNRGKEEREKQEKEFEARRQQQKAFLDARGLQADLPPRFRKTKIEEQFAILVGGYKDMDSARKALNSIRKLDAPQTVPVDSVAIAEADPADNTKKTAMVQRFSNPFPTSFVVHNPSIPMDRPNQGPDPMLKELNEDESYSLLKSNKAWTLVVKEFFGRTIVQSQSAPLGFISKLFGGGDNLDAGAKQAHEVVRVLRDMKFEAYVLHTRHGSIVAVGGYDSPEDARLQQNAHLLANMQLGPTIRFFAQPVPMQVPRP